MKRRILFVVVLFFATAVLMAVQKPLFMAFHAARCADCGAEAWWQVVRHGWTLDLTVAGYVTALPLLLALASVWVPLDGRRWRLALAVYLVAVSVVAAAVFAVDLGLYGYWGFRIDSSVLLYLKSPKEAAASVSGREWLVQGSIFLLAAAVLSAVLLSVSRLLETPKLSFAGRAAGTAAMLLLGGLCFLAIRGGASVATANVSKVYFSSNQFLNHAATNPLFSLLSTLGDDKDLRPQYLFFDEEERAARFGEIRGDRPDSVVGSRLLRTTRPNVVVVILESFGRTFTDERVGGEWVTPNLQRLKAEGVWFENIFANSFRTDRGEVAILNGFPAQTRMSIMKYPAKSRTLPSIARSLAAEGYETEFVYGGDLNFTDQASYMYATGWERLVWQKELRFDAPVSKWGYADDVMAGWFGDEVLRLAGTGRPFLAGWLTLSSHEPFEVPYARFEDKILNAVAFTDDCVGRMIGQWRRSPAWDDLLVVLIADHAYPYPAGLPYNVGRRHRIPMIWTGGAVAGPAVVEEYGSQIDLAATLLGQMEVDHTPFIYSKDLLSPSVPKFGYWCFNEGFGIADPQGETVYDCTSGRVLIDDDPASGRLERGKALLQTTYMDIGER